MSDTQNIETICNNLSNICGVEAANIWEKHGKQRIYIEVAKQNGGKNWNGGRAGTIFFDANKNKIIYKGDWAGARTRDYAIGILKIIESELGIPYERLETTIAN